MLAQPHRTVFHAALSCNSHSDTAGSSWHGAGAAIRVQHFYFRLHTLGTWTPFERVVVWDPIWTSSPHTRPIAY